MDAIKHTPTPGPWETNPADKREIIAPGEPMVICRTSDELYQKAAPANAHLIAAAPDLLSIVKRFVALPSGAWHPERHAADEAELMVEARAAIAKATGGDA